jgi:hypothetical protein
MYPLEIEEYFMQWHRLLCKSDGNRIPTSQSISTFVAVSNGFGDILLALSRGSWIMLLPKHLKKYADSDFLGNVPLFLP